MPAKARMSAPLSNVTDDVTEEERQFLVAIDRYKRRNHRPFPTWREVLAIVKSMGYVRAGKNVPAPETGVSKAGGS